MRVIFVGHPGAGKTFAAELLGSATGIEKVDADSLFDWHPVIFVSKRVYFRAFRKLIGKKKEWIIDSYHGHRMPDSVWLDADIIVFINLPRDELVKNVLRRFRVKKQTKNNSHGQATYINTAKNLSQIYLLDRALLNNVKRIKHLIGDDGKFIELRSRRDVENFIRQMTAQHRQPGQ